MDILSLSIGVPTDDARWWRIVNVTKQLCQRNHNIYHVCYGRNPESNESHQKGLEVLKKWSTDISIIDSNVLTSPLNHLRTDLDIEAFDCIYGNNHMGAFLANLRISSKIPVVYDIHGHIIHEHILNYSSKNTQLGVYAPSSLAKLLMKYFIKEFNHYRSDTIFCVSERMVQEIVNEGVPRNRISYVTNGVDLEMYSPDISVSKDIIQQIDLENSLVFGYVGGFQEWQGVDKLISTADHIDNDNFGFLFVGDRRENRKNIQFIPRVRRGLVPQYYSVCDILVLPRPQHMATEVAAPTKFAEYAAMGKPILATDVGDAAKLIRRYNCGIIVEDNNINCLRRGIEEFESTNEEEIKQMGENARELAKNEFNWDTIGDVIESEFENVN